MRRLLLLAVSLLAVIASARPETWNSSQPCPEHISTTIPGSGAFPGMSTIHEALLTCPDIKSLQVHATVFGCSEFPDRFNLPLSLNGTDKYLPALESLSLEGYDFKEKEFEHFEWWVDAPWLPRAPKTRWDGEGWGSFLARSLDEWFMTWQRRLKDLDRWHYYQRLTPEQRNQTNFDLLLQSMDFSQIRDLSIRDSCWHEPEHAVATLQQLAGALSSAQSFEAWGTFDCMLDREYEDESNYTYATSPVLDFIAAMAPTGLKNLTWVDGGTCDPIALHSVLDRHGPSLTALEWRNNEWEWKNRTFFTTEALQTLGKQAPNLVNLTIDLNSNGEWPVDQLQAIAEGMPNLTDLMIYFPYANALGREARNASLYRYENPRMDREYDRLYGREDLRAHPILNESSAETIFRLLQDSKTGSPFNMVHFRNGDWTRPYSGPMRIPSEFLFEQVNEWFACTNERDDGTPKGEAEAVCQQRYFSWYPWIDEDEYEYHWGDGEELGQEFIRGY